VAEAFAGAHTDLPPTRPLDEPRQLLDEARAVLRRRFLEADVGITGANFLVAETGSTIIVTNEGNGDLTQQLPRVHVVLTSIEKVVPTLDDATLLLRLLARSATGQEFSSYTTLSTGPRRAEDPDGPAEFHVVLLDNGRSAMLGGEFQDALRCIRCAACINHCPVYGAVGGHAYGWVYPGPIGSVISPALVGLAEARHLPNASTLCGRCEAVCPMRIPLPRMLRHWREHEFERHLQPARVRWALRLWSWLACRPALYRLAAAAGARILAVLGRNGSVRSAPLAAAWTRTRDLPAPSGATFLARWSAGERNP
jgi:L-lactate dehydrogenase complex protein LldF